MSSRFLVAAAVVAVAVSGTIILGRGATPEDIAQLTTQLGDANWETRSEAYYQVVDIGAAGSHVRVGAALSNVFKSYPGQADPLKVALIKTLDAENKVVKTTESLGEDFTDYYGDLISGVTSWPDPRSVGPLSDAMGTGHMVVSTLASLGQAAVGPVMEKLRAEGGINKQAACVVLGMLMDPANPSSIKDPATRARIKDELKRAAQDVAGAYIRAAAVEGLAKVGDKDVVAFLSNVARTDGYDASSLVGQSSAFPVREAAVAALQKVGQSESSPASNDALGALKALAGGGQGVPAPAQDIAKDVLKRWGLGLRPKTEPPPEQKPAPKPPANP